MLSLASPRIATIKIIANNTDVPIRAAIKTINAKLKNANGLMLPVSGSRNKAQKISPKSSPQLAHPECPGEPNVVVDGGQGKHVNSKLHAFG